MIDQCKHCIVRGDMNECLKTECAYHENWYALELKKRIEQQAKELEALRGEIKKLKEDVNK